VFVPCEHFASSGIVTIKKKKKTLIRVKLPLYTYNAVILRFRIRLCKETVLIEYLFGQRVLYVTYGSKNIHLPINVYSQELRSRVYSLPLNYIECEYYV
jgi:hypothetical protein